MYKRQVSILSNYKSIFEALCTGMKNANILADDYVILCHDDIEILTNAKDFNLFIHSNLEKQDVGFLGVAGTRMLKNSCVWWEDLNKNTEYMNPLSGFVLHGKKEGAMYGSWYGPYGHVAVLDGLFLCAKGSTLNSINLKKPKFFEGDWDFYDIYYTTQATLKGKKNYTIPIQVIHESIGDLVGRESWHKNRLSFSNTFSEHLPLVAGIVNKV